MFRHLRGYSPSIYSCWKLLVNLLVHLHVLTGPERVAPLEKNATTAASHWSLRTLAHRLYMGRRPRPLSPPATNHCSRSM